MLLLFLLALGFFGWVVGREILGLESPAPRLLTGFCVALCCSIFSVNAALRLGLAPGSALICTAVLLVLAGILLYQSSEEEEEPSNPPLGRWEGLLLALGMLLVVFCTNTTQLVKADEDYWIHTALQGHMLKGEFPPMNPFFSELPLNGHYGRDLTIVCLAKMTGIDVLRSQMLVTSAFQGLLFGLCYLTLRRFCGSGVEAVLGLLFLFFGMNVGYRAGLIDASTNHAAVAHLELTLIVYLILLLWRSPNRARAALAGLVLGNFAIVYFTHYGLALMALTGSGLSLWALGILRAEHLRYTAGAVVISLSLAFTQGGPFTDLTRRLGKAKLPSTMALQNQTHSVNVKFPKSPFLNMAIGVNDKMYSTAYRHWPASKILTYLDGPPRRTNDLYVPLWSWAVLRMHWLAVYLAPLSLMVLLWHRHSAGLLYWFFGFSAFLTPGLFDFGVLHEVEYFRWLLGTGFGWATALGIAVGSLAAAAAGKVRFLVYPLAALIFWLNTLAGADFFYYTPSLVTKVGSWGRAACLGMSTDQWLAMHAAHLRLHPADVTAFRWLAEHCEPRQTVLVNFDQGDPWAIHMESTLAGLTGLYPLGHSLPRDNDVIGFPPFRMTAEALQFYTEPNLENLQRVSPDWLYLRVALPDLELQIEKIPGVEKVYHDLSGADRVRRSVFRVNI